MENVPPTVLLDDQCRNWYNRCVQLHLCGAWVLNCRSCKAGVGVLFGVVHMRLVLFDESTQLLQNVVTVRFEGVTQSNGGVIADGRNLVRQLFRPSLPKRLEFRRAGVRVGLHKIPQAKQVSSRTGQDSS